MRYTSRLIPGLLAGSLLIGGGSSVFASQGTAPARPHLAFASGQVSNLSGSGFTLTRAPKVATSGVTPTTFQVTLGSKVKEQARKGTTGAIANGEYALVVGQKTAAGITAQRVVYSAKRFNVSSLIAQVKAHRLANRIARALLRSRLRPGLVRGTVSASSPTSLSITTLKGKALTFTITPATKYRVNKQLSTTAPAFTSGETVGVRFVRNLKTHVTRARVVIVPAVTQS